MDSTAHTDGTNEDVGEAGVVMANTAAVRWGVVGTANIGRVAVIPAIRASSNGVLAAVASRDAERAAAFARDNGIPRAYGSYQALLDDPDIDTVYIPLPNSEHREWTVRATEAGKHVLCEKPLAMNAQECEEMVVAAERAGVTLMEAFMYRFHPRLARVQEIVNEGAIGDLRLIRSTFSFRLTRPDNIRLSTALGGGALMDVGCYCVNVSRTIVGAEPVEAQAFARWTSSGVDDEFVGTLRFPGGVMAQLDCALTMERRERYEVVGTEGALEVDRAFLPGKGAVVVRELRGGAEPVEHPVPGDDEYRLMVEHFAGCVLNGRAPLYSAREAERNMKAIEALYRSARDGGRPTPVD